VNDSAIFQRTERGRTEIRHKMHELTQSERLALIVIDGITPYSELRKKLKGLADERFGRALANLLQKNLVFEVLLLTADAEQDEYDSATVDRFLQQDPMDPVTIISFDAENEFDLDMEKEAQSSLPVTKKSVLGPVLVAPKLALTNGRSEDIALAAAKAAIARIASVDFYIPLESTHDKLARAIPSQAVTANTSRAQAASDADQHVAGFTQAPRKLTWAQILIAIGIVLIGLSVFVKFAH
jgi:hypothetical protein